MEDKNIDLLKIINTEIFVRTLEFDNILNKVVIISNTLNSIYWWNLTIDGDDRYSKITYLNVVLKKVGFDINKFNFALNTPDYTINRYLRNKIYSIYPEGFEDKSVFNDIIKEDFTLPLVIILNHGITAEILGELRGGWSKSFDYSQKKNDRNNEKDGLFIITMNILEKNINGKMCFDKLIYSQYRYNKIFTQPLISYIEEITKIKL